MYKKLYEIADIHPGYPFRGSIPSEKSGTVHVVQVRDTRKTGKILLDKIIKTNLSGKKAPNWLQNGDILFVAKGAKHYSALVEELPKDTVCSPHFFLIRIKKEYRHKVNPEFACWQLNQLPAQKYFIASAEGSLYLSIRKGVLENTPIKLIGIEQQQVVANMNKCAVKKQALLQQLIENIQKEQTAISLELLN